MSSEIPDPYEAVLNDLRAKRDQIEQTILLLSSLRSSGSASAIVAPPQPAENSTVETAGMFLGMSIVDAAKKLLAIRKQTMGNVEIAKELQSGGLVLTSAEPANVIGSVLTRRFQQIGDVVKVGRGIWGLKEWYPGRTFKPAIKTLQVIGPHEPVEMTPEVRARVDANLSTLESSKASGDIDMA